MVTRSSEMLVITRKKHTITNQKTAIDIIVMENLRKLWVILLSRSAQHITSEKRQAFISAEDSLY